jgi:hypothetical protein
MKRLGFAALTALGGAVVLAGWSSIGVTSFSPAAIEFVEADEAEPVAVKGSLLTVANAAEAEADAVPAAPLPVGAVVDSSLLSPHPMLAAGALPIQPVALSTTEPAEKPAQVTGSIPQVASSTAPAPVPPAVKKASPAPRLEKDGTLTVAQIGRIKASLHLSPDQEQHWIPVEAELRQIARQLAAQKTSGSKAMISLAATDAQRLYWAAGPLLMSLREDQKKEVRRLARAMGLEQVASLI